MALATLLTTFVSCATPYQPIGPRGGYSETKIQKEIYDISFQGNSYTYPLRVRDFALLRAAEIATNADYRYFHILEETDVTAHRMSSSGLFGDPYGGGHSGQVYSAPRPGVVLRIILYKAQPRGPRVVYDATQIVGNIRHKYGMQGPSVPANGVQPDTAPSSSNESAPPTNDPN